MGNFQAVFLIILSLFANLKLMRAFYSRKVFSLQVYKLETLKNCNEVKHMMIMIITIIYIFLYSIWNLIKSSKLLSENPQPPPPSPTHPHPKKFTPPFLLNPPSLELQKVQVTPFCQHWIFFSLPPKERIGEGHCGYGL